MKNCITLCFLVAFITSATPQESRFCHLVSTETNHCTTENNTLKSVKSYYYFPNMQVYYDIEKEIYHYLLNKNWVTSQELPAYYGGYSLFKNERVMVTIANGDEPQKYINEHRKEFPYNPKGRIKRPTPLVAENDTALIQ